MNQPAEKAAIFDKPAYPAREAAYILNLPSATVNAWSFGQTRRDDGRVSFKAVIRAADARNKLLSFANLYELHVLTVTRRVHGVSLPKVRDSVEICAASLAWTGRLSIASSKPTGSIFLSNTPANC